MTDTSELDEALRALSEVGTWLGTTAHDAPAAQQLRADIRRQARRIGFRVRTVANAAGCVYAYVWAPTAAGQGLPGTEPWRGAAVTYRASELPAAVARGDAGLT